MKHSCNAKAGVQSCRKDLSEVITNQAEKYQKEMCNIQEKLCLLQATGALPTTRFNCSNANPQLLRAACEIFTVKGVQLKRWLRGAGESCHCLCVRNTRMISGRMKLKCPLCVLGCSRVI